MSIQIKLKNSVVQDSTPSASDLPEVGELAVNGNINSIGGFMRASDNTIVKIFGPGSVTTPTATTTVSGISELATNSETTTGTATNRVVTPAGLNAVTVAERTTSNTNYVAKAGSTLTGVLTMPNGSNSAPAINFGDSDSGIFGGTNTVSLAAGGTTRLTADTGVSVVGTLAVTGAITSTSDLTIADKIIHSGDTNTAIRFPAADTVSVETGGSEAIRVDSSQRLFVGVTSGTVGGFSPKLFVERADSSASIGIFRSAASNFGPFLLLGKSRASSLGGSTIVQDDDRLGQIAFFGADGTDRNTQAAEIKAEVDGTPGANDMPGRLVFSTTADGAASPTERLRIDSSGKIGINESSPLAKFHVKVADSGASAYAHCAAVFEDSDHTFIDIMSGTTGSGGINFGDSGGSQRGVVEYDHNSDFMRLIVAGGEAMRIDSSGRLLLGTTTEGATNADKFTLATSGHTGITIRSGTTHQSAIYMSDATSGDGEYAGYVLYDHNVDALRFGANTSDRMRIDSSGNVGIGTTSPSAKLNIEDGSGDDFQGIRIINTHNDANAIDTSFIRLGITNVGGEKTTQIAAVQESNGGNAVALRFSTNSSGSNNGETEKMRILGSGNVGIGTTSPALPLHIAASVPGIRLADSDGNTPYSNITAGGGDLVFEADQGNEEANTLMLFRVDDSERMRIDSSGNVIVKTNDVALSGSGTLRINSGSTAGALNLDGGASNHGGEINLLGGSNGGRILFRSGVGAGQQGEKMRLDENGNLGIGTTSPAKLLDVKLESNGTVEQYLRNTVINLLSKINGTTSAQFGTETSHPLAFIVANNERMRIDSSGRLLIGATSIGVASTFYDDLVISNTASGTGAGITLIANATNGFNAIDFCDTAAAGRGRITYGHDVDRMMIDVGGSEAMRIVSDGKVGLGTTTPLRRLHQHENDSGANYHQFTNSTTGAGADDGGYVGLDASENLILWNQENNKIRFATNNTERMQITSGGKILIARTNEDGSGVINLALNSSGHGISTRTAVQSTQTHLDFGNQNGIVGSIQTSGSGTSFNTSSDYRLKENAVAISDGITRLKTLKPYRFNFKTDSSTILDGFFAHEVSSAVPEAISGTKDAVDEDNNPIHQGIDQSKLVPLLVAAVQELIGRVETLEAA